MIQCSLLFLINLVKKYEIYIIMQHNKPLIAIKQVIVQEYKLYEYIVR